MSDIQKVKVFDERIIQERPVFKVQQGALSLTNAPFNAIASTQSQMTFNVQVPSQNVFVDREFEWTAGVKGQMDVAVAGVGGAPAPASTPVVSFGKDVALAPFPLHSLCSTMTATINDAVSTINTSDVLYEVLRLVDIRKNHLDKTTPYMLDKYSKYDDAVGAINNPLASYVDATDYNNIPNGAFWDVVFTDKDGTELTDNGSYDDNLNATPINFENGVPILTDPSGGNALTNYRIYFRFRATEKLILSPFIFNDSCAESVGLFGVNNIQTVFNFQPPSRLVRNAPSASGANGRTISNVGFNGANPFDNPRLNIRFLTPSLDVALPPKSVVPYLEYPRYISTGLNQIAGNSNGLVTSQTITLPQIPDMLVIWAKPSITSPERGDYYMPIDQITVNFDNFSGLLSSMTPQQLYNMSVENGLRMDWNTWNGLAKGGQAVNYSNIQTVGGFLVLRMGKDITLQSGQAPSVVGNYTLQFNCRVNNRDNVAATPTLYVMAINSGYFETMAGSSRIVKGVLTEQEVIQAPNANMTSQSLDRLVGGAMTGGSVLSKLGNIGSRLFNLLQKPEVRQVAKDLARSAGVNKLSQAVDIAESLGFGRTGGRQTGGRRKANMNNLM